MARIRSIKPDFFTSETIASLPLSARLTFIGLWTYVDDNGVGLDNEMLITAAIWPLEEDHAGVLNRTVDDLKILADRELIFRYESSRDPRESLAKSSRKSPQTGRAPARRRFLFVTSWDEHQKVDHPRKPRYPRPEEADDHNAPASANMNPRESLAKVSRETHEDLAPEQGSGSRDQGAGIVAPAAGAETHRAPRKPRAPANNVSDVIAAYVDGAVAAGQPRPAEELRKRVGSQANRLLAEGYALDVLVASARTMGAGEWNDLAVQIRKDAAGANGSSKRPMRGGAAEDLSGEVYGEGKTRI